MKTRKAVTSCPRHKDTFKSCNPNCVKTRKNSLATRVQKSLGGEWIEASQHTPGPWSVHIVNGEALVKGNPHEGEVGTATDIVARVERNEDGDARLIATAPELLEALKRAHSELDRLQEGGIFVPIGKTCWLCDVIAKAEGK